MHLSNQQAAILCLKNNCRVECHLISTRHLSLGFQHGPALFCSFPSFLFYFLPFPTLFYSTFYSCLLFSTLFLQYNTLFLHYYTVHSFHLSTSHLSLSLQHRSALFYSFLSFFALCSSINDCSYFNGSPQPLPPAPFCSSPPLQSSPNGISPPQLELGS